MKALAIDHFDAAGLHQVEVEPPCPAHHEVVIDIAYTSLNPVDWKMCGGLFQGRIPHGFPLIPGWDAAGTIADVGSEVKSFRVGDPVYAYCRKPVIQWGTYAEKVVVEAAHVAPKPQKLTFAQAAAIPLVGLTTWQALVEAAKLKAGESILIHAGAGGVGSFAIQLAKSLGAKVYTTCGPRNIDYVKSLGADAAIDYTQGSFVEKMAELAPGGVDVVYDCIGEDATTQSIDVLKNGGRLIGIVGKPDLERCAERDIFFKYIFVRPNGEQLREIGQLIDAGKILPPHIVEMPLSEALRAFEQSRGGHVRGKIVFKIDF